MQHSNKLHNEQFMSKNSLALRYYYCTVIFSGWPFNATQCKHIEKRMQSKGYWMPSTQWINNGRTDSLETIFIIYHMGLGPAKFSQFKRQSLLPADAYYQAQCKLFDKVRRAVASDLPSKIEIVFSIDTWKYLHQKFLIKLPQQLISN